MNGHSAGSSKEGRPYQGYPYTSPLVHDVASIDPTTAAQWSDLPRRPGALYDRPSTLDKAEAINQTPEIQGRAETLDRAEAINHRPGALSQRSGGLVQGPGPLYGRPETKPGIFEGPGGSRALPFPRTPDRTPTEDVITVSQGAEVKIDYDTHPVVYIDVPQSNGSDVAERRPPVEESFVQQTIFYDQFKDQSVVTVPNEFQGSSRSYISSNSSGRPNRPTRPAPPVTLSLGSESGYASRTRTPGSPSHLQIDQNSLVQSSIPDMLVFPNPPPAYSEFDPQAPSSGSPTIIQQPLPSRSPGLQSTPPLNSPQTIYRSPIAQSPDERPRTQVILTEVDTKNTVIYCKSCRVSSNSLPIHQSGYATHMCALFLFLMGCFPCILMLYISRCCRYNNHYCKLCNKLVAYESPCFWKKMKYVDD